MGKHPTKANNICLSLIRRLYTNKYPACPPGSLKDTDKTRDFAYIRKHSSAFVDKTHKIKNITERSQRDIVYFGSITLAPPNFGKSVNLSMLKYFFEIEVNRDTGEPLTKANIHKEAVTDTWNYKLFENLAIHRLEPEFMKTWFGRYPVIHLDFSLRKSINSYQDAVDHCRTVVREAFKQHAYLFNTANKSGYETCKVYCDDVKYEKYKTKIDCGSLASDIYLLQSTLCKHFNKRCVLLVDEYDAIFRASIVSTDENTLEKCRFLYSGIIERLVKDNGYCVAAILSGTSHMAVYRTRDMDRFNIHIFLWHSDADLFDNWHSIHGFTQEEFDYLMDKHNVPADLRQEAAEYYGSYSMYRNKKIYNPYSIVRFLDSRIIHAYPTDFEFFEKHRHMLNYEDINLILIRLIFGETLKIYLGKHPHLYNLHDKDREINKSGYFFWCLYERGYLQRIHEEDEEEYNETPLLKLANKEAKFRLLEQMEMYYKISDRFHFESMKVCAEYFDNINFASNQVCENDTLYKIHPLLEKYCEAFFTKIEKKIAKVHDRRVIVEENLRRLFYHIASLTKYEITIIDPSKYSPYGSKKPLNEITPDIKMCSYNNCIMIQAKYNSTAQEALNQLILHSSRNETTNCVLIGINLKKNKRVKRNSKRGNIFSRWKVTTASKVFSKV